MKCGIEETAPPFSVPLSSAADSRTLRKMPVIEEVVEEESAPPPANRSTVHESHGQRRSEDMVPADVGGKGVKGMDGGASQSGTMGGSVAAGDGEAKTDAPEGRGKGALEENKDEDDDMLTEAERLDMEERLERARGLKQAGNQLFAEHDYTGAALRYTEAIDECPEKHKDRAVFFNNRATCYFKMGEYDKVITDCTSALRLDADYSKCLLRRAQAYEATKKVADAYDDFQRVTKLDPGNSIAVGASRRLEGPAKEEREKQKDEMLGKLKELGNSVLGRFGISLDNFKAVQDPATGSYSVSYNPGGQ